MPWVYPRVCGVDLLSPYAVDDLGGLSPRVRGRFRVEDRALVLQRFIPACAG